MLSIICCTVPISIDQWEHSTVIIELLMILTLYNYKIYNFSIVPTCV